MARNMCELVNVKHDRVDFPSVIVLLDPDLLAVLCGVETAMFQYVHVGFLFSEASGPGRHPPGHEWIVGSGSREPTRPGRGRMCRADNLRALFQHYHGNMIHRSQFLR